MDLSTPNSKNRIIISAIELFAENGYTETTMNSIAKAAGMKAASIYNYFESKKQILEYALSIYTEFNREMFPATTDAYILENDPKAVLKELFIRFDPSSTRMYLQIIKIFLQEQYRIDEVREYMKVHYLDSIQLHIQAVLDKMVELGRIPPVNTVLFAEALHAVNLKSAVTACHYINNPEERPYDRWEDSINFIIDIIVNT